MGRNEYLRARSSRLEERQRYDPAGDLSAVDVEGQRGSGGRELRGEVGEGDPLSQRGRETPARRLGHRLTCGPDRRTVARDRARFVHLDPDEPTLRSLGPLLLERWAPDEHVVEVDEPVLAGLEGGMVPMELLSGEEVALLEAQGVSRP